jgi:hypothetical protein
MLLKKQAQALNITLLFQKKPLLIVHGENNPDLHPSRLPANVRAVMVKSKYPYGTHHSKLMVFHYEDDSIRVVVSTANLVSSDWENRTQGLWVSPRDGITKSGCKVLSNVPSIVEPNGIPNPKPRFFVNPESRLGSSLICHQHFSGSSNGT